VTWGKHDDHGDDDPRWWGCPLAAQGLYWAVLPYCLRKGENFVPVGLCVRTAYPSHEEPMTGPLVVRGLWTEVSDDGGQVSGYAYTESDWSEIVFPEEERERRREAAKEGGLKSAEARRSKYGSARPRSHFEVPSEATAKRPAKPPEAHLEATVKSREAVPVPVPEPVVAEATPPVAPHTEDVRRIFEAEVAARVGKGSVLLTSKRQLAAERRLGQGYTLTDCMDAVRACCADEWCQRTGNDNMAYCLRDGETLEKFRNQGRYSRAAPRPREGPSAAVRAPELSQAERDFARGLRGGPDLEPIGAILSRTMPAGGPT